MNSVSGHNTWIVICDGGKALLLENVGSRFHPVLKTRDVMEQESLPSRRLGASAPGRTQKGMTGRRAAMDETDLHDRVEEEFLRSVGAKLDRQIGERNIRALVLVAPARAMGTLRSALSDTARQLVSGELVRDLVNMPVHEIECNLTDLP
jgi:protein required for attachment to host cells